MFRRRTLDLRGLLLFALYSVVGCATVNPQAAALIEYRRSGGIAGREDRLVVRTDGTAQLWRRTAASDFQLSPDTLAQLRTMLARTDFRSLRSEYLLPRSGADLFEYVVIYKDRTVRTMDTAVPAELGPLIQLLSSLVNTKR